MKCAISADYQFQLEGESFIRASILKNLVVIIAVVLMITMMFWKQATADF